MHQVHVLLNATHDARHLTDNGFDEFGHLLNPEWHPACESLIGCSQQEVGYEAVLILLNISSLFRWQLMEVAAGHVSSNSVKSGNGFADVLQWTLATAASNHLTVLRSFGHGVDPSFPLQEKPGNSETQFLAMWLDHFPERYLFDAGVCKQYSWPSCLKSPTFTYEWSVLSWRWDLFRPGVPFKKIQIDN